MLLFFAVLKVRTLIPFETPTRRPWPGERATSMYSYHSAVANQVIFRTICGAKSEHRNSSNNSRPSNNRPPPTLLAIFSFFYPLPVNCDRKMTYSFLFFISYISSALGLTFTRKTALKFLNLKINGPWKRRDVRGLASGVRVACCARVMNSWHPPSAGICLGARFF